MIGVCLGVVGGGGGSLVTASGSLGVDSGALVGDVSDEAVIAVGGVLHVLDSAIGKGNRVRSGNVGGAVRGLLGLEVGLGIVISHGVGEGVGALLSKVISNVAGLDGSLVSWGVNHGSGVGGGGVDSVSDNRGGVNSVVDGGVDGMSDGGVDKGSVDGVSHVLGGDRVEGDDGGLALGDGAVSEHGGLDLSETLGVVSLGHTGVGGAESLALGQGSHLKEYNV